VEYTNEADLSILYDDKIHQLQLVAPPLPPLAGDSPFEGLKKLPLLVREKNILYQASESTNKIKCTTAI
jgi:hypothetical protein